MNFLRGLHAFESTKVDFPYQNGTSVPGRVRTDPAEDQAERGRRSEETQRPDEHTPLADTDSLIVR
jgi:hypothetical protein